ncbi:ABC transporter ATP-binding protein [Alphaproteobacteria bacterium]|nr:ABC transporter ATP-binding protein [Alphaproteobacteria bacterium]MDC1407508.1 ABC transporter ATP-binding protein [Candidatus Puniceispirillum sp.]
MDPILKINNLQTHFFTKAGILKAVDGVSFEIGAGEIVGLVGESGSGKSITGFSVMGLVDPPGKIIDGSINFKGQDLSALSNNQMQGFRGNRIAMIFQDPMMTLNPVLRIETQMIEAIQAHDGSISREDARIRSRDTLGLVGISSPDERLRAYPHQFSGGMRQRVSIAIAMLNRPDLIIADEPTTALDVTIQGQVISEMQKLCRETQTALLWITHDLAVVAGIADRVCVMYAGRIVEQGSVANIIANPMHPYTQGLMGSVPSQNRRGKPLQQINGMVPSMLNLPAGCAFQNRCNHANEKCSKIQPDITQLADRRQVRCFNVPAGQQV